MTYPNSTLKVKLRIRKQLGKYIGDKYLLLGIFCFLFFAAELIYLAIAIVPGISPDEHYHFGLIQLFANNGHIPPPFLTQSSGFVLGDVEHLTSFLYHYLLSFIPLGGSITLQGYVILRLTNLLFPMLTLYFFMKSVLLLTKDKKTTILAAFILITTSMFVFLSSSISYDNLSILCAVASYYYLIKFYKNLEVIDLLLFLLIVVISPIVKYTSAPIIITEVLFLLIILAKNRSTMLLKLKALYTQRNFWTISTHMILLSLVLLGGLYTFGFYLTNFRHYSTFFPACNAIHTHEECTQNGIYNRTLELNKIDPDSVNPELPVQYLGIWINKYFDGIYGIAGHESIPPEDLYELLMIILIGFWTVATIRKFDYRDRIDISGVVLSAIYIFFILYLTNYREHLRSGLHIATQGRYLFPIYPILIYFAAKYSLIILRNRKRTEKFYIISLVFIMLLGSIYAFFTGVESSWLNHYDFSYLEQLCDEFPLVAICD